MQGKKKYCFCIWLAIASFHCLMAQGPGKANLLVPDHINEISSDQSIASEDSLFSIRHIFIEGNRKTKASIILREIPLQEGQKYSLPDIVRKFETSRRQLMNTLLFHEAVVALKSFEGYNIDVVVKVKERWYIFPIPYFKPVDRNLNQWLFEKKASLDRIDYGIKLLYNNVTGRNDKLTLWGINGYTKQLSFTYDRLYFDKKMKWGYSIGFAIGKNREINYNSEDNKQVFFKGNDFVRSFTSVNAELTYRNAIKTRHRFGIAYKIEDVADTVLQLNSSYFRSGQTRIEYPELYYTMNYYNVDYIPYPTKGYLGRIDVVKKGINSSVNLFQVGVQASGYWHTGKKSFIGLESYGMIKLPFSQPYFNRRFLGYGGNNLQGYEYYVIDGVAGGYLKASFVRKIFSFDINMPRTKALTPGKIPFTFYAKIYGNTGYIYNPDKGSNSLANRFLYSSGIGLDVITLYDFLLRLEWSFNQLGQNGVFLHPRSIF